MRGSIIRRETWPALSEVEGVALAPMLWEAGFSSTTRSLLNLCRTRVSDPHGQWRMAGKWRAFHLRSWAMDDKVKEFFAQYERANAEFNVAEIASLYADVFLFGGTQGAQSIKKDDFVKVLPRRKDFFKSVGLVASKVARIETSELAPNYLLAKVVWKMRIERPEKAPAEIETSATYVLLSSAGSLQIVFQVDHQDLAAKIKELT